MHQKEHEFLLLFYAHALFQNLISFLPRRFPFPAFLERNIGHWKDKGYHGNPFKKSAPQAIFSLLTKKTLYKIPL